MVKHNFVNYAGGGYNFYFDRKVDSVPLGEQDLHESKPQPSEQLSAKSTNTPTGELTTTSPTATFQQEIPRLAPIIGNSDYASAPLKNTTNDVNDIAIVLSKLGFEVTKLLNASQKVMESEIREFDRRLQSGAVGLYYYAGHGIQIEGSNYLIPLDARMETERRGLARMDNSRGSMLAYATAPGSVAREGSGRNGIYTGALLHQLQNPGLSIEQVLRKTRIDVMKTTENLQVPWEASSLTGDFFFISPANPPTQ